MSLKSILSKVRFFGHFVLLIELIEYFFLFGLEIYLWIIIGRFLAILLFTFLDFFFPKCSVYCFFLVVCRVWILSEGS